jgi:cobalamin biosynthesis protein CobD/CbiB
VQLGGVNRYNSQPQSKPVLNRDAGPVTPAAVEQMLQLSQRMSLQWLGWSGAGIALLSAIQ